MTILLAKFFNAQCRVKSHRAAARSYNGDIAPHVQPQRRCLAADHRDGVTLIAGSDPIVAAGYCCCYRRRGCYVRGATVSHCPDSILPSHAPRAVLCCLCRLRRVAESDGIAVSCCHAWRGNDYRAV